MTTLIIEAPARSATKQFASKSGQSYVRQILDIMSVPYNRDRLMFSCPSPRALAYDQVGAETGLSRRTLQDIASIVDKLATAHRVARYYPEANAREPAPYVPTLLNKVVGTSLDKVKEIDALCQLANIPAEMKAITKALDRGESVSAISRLAILTARRQAGMADTAKAMAVEVASWSERDRDRFLAFYKMELARAQPETVGTSGNDAAITLAVAMRSLIELEQRGLEEAAMLQERASMLKNLECKFRDLGLDNSERIDALRAYLRRAKKFVAYLNALATNQDDMLDWVPSGDRAAVLVPDHFTAILDHHQHRRPSSRAPRDVPGEGGEIARLKEENQLKNQIIADLIQDVRRARAALKDETPCGDVTDLEVAMTTLKGAI